LSASTDGTTWFKIDNEQPVNFNAMALNSKTLTPWTLLSGQWRSIGGLRNGILGEAAISLGV
jgi:hypothetical protein